MTPITAGVTPHTEGDRVDSAHLTLRTEADRVDVSVVVATYTPERWGGLAACVAALGRQTVTPLEVIVVVDHHPELLAAARRGLPSVMVVENNRARGLAGARNTGIVVAKGSIVAFVDDDAQPEADWLERLHACFADPAAVGAGGSLLPRWTNGAPRWLPPEFYWVLGCSYTGLPERVAPVRNPIGANMAVRKRTLEEIGGFREGGAGDEPRAIRSRGVVRAQGNVPDDTDLAIRVKQRWPRSIWLYEPQATVHHTVTPERASLSYFLRRSFEEGAGKARLAAFVGSRDGLSSERRHLRVVVPRGIARGLRQLLEGDLQGGLRAVAIVTGLASSAAGFLLTRLGGVVQRGCVTGLRVVKRHAAEPVSSDFAPQRMDAVEIGAPLPSLSAADPRTGITFGSSLCLVRLHGRPLGLIPVDLAATGVPAEALAARIQSELAAEIAQHLNDDGLPASTLDARGVAGVEHPPCVAPREEVLRSAPTVSVVICTRDRPDSVRTTLRSILACRYPAGRLEVIVVDNASEADAAVSLDAAEFNPDVRVRVLREPEPGLSNGRNAGLRGATGEIVVFADDDVEVDRDWLATLVRPFGRSPRVGATSGMTLPGTLETPAQRWVEGFGGRVRGFDTHVYDLAHPPHGQPLFPFTVGDLGAGRNMAFRRDVLTELGGFDPALGPGTLAHDGDDIEALLRVLLSGRQVVHDPAAIVWHAHPREYRELEQRVWGYGVGLTACLTKAIVSHPRLLPDLVRKLPRGLVFALSPKSAKNAGRQRDFPSALIRLELRGMAYGPLAYARSRWRRRRRSHSPPSPRPTPPPSSLRVLMVTDEYRPYIGGAGRCIELFAQELTRLGHTVAVATAWHPSAPAFEDDGGIQIHRIRDLPSRMRWISEDPRRHTPPPFPDPEAVWRLRRLIRDFRPDLIPAYGWLAHSAAAALIGKRIPLILWAHEYGNVCGMRTMVRGAEICSGPRPAKCLACSVSGRGAPKGTVAALSVRGVRPLLRRKTAAIHSVSHYVAEVMNRDLNVAGAPSVVIPNFHVEETDSAVDEELLARLPKESFILFVGAFRRLKGIDELIAAHERLTSPPPLVLVGIKTPDTPASFPPGVTALTAVPHATVMAMWERALFGVFPSKWPEPLATVVHEAMSSGRPVIGTTPGGHEDMIDDGQTGFVVPGGDAGALAEAMARLVDDQALRERLGREAKRRASRFKPEAVVPQLERFYYETVAASRRA